MLFGDECFSEFQSRHVQLASKFFEWCDLVGPYLDDFP